MLLFPAAEKVTKKAAAVPATPKMTFCTLSCLAKLAQNILPVFNANDYFCIVPLICRMHAAQTVPRQLLT